MRFYLFWGLESGIVWLIGGTIAVVAWAISVAGFLALIMMARGYEEDDGDWFTSDGPADDPTCHDFPLAPE